jgi:isoleucyl-tRNA synthetase
MERKVKEGSIALTSEGITVALDTELNEELLMEGLARELISKLNMMRRDSGFAVTDRIQVKMDTTPRVKECFETFREMIMHETLATEVLFVKCEGASWDLNGETTTITLMKR